MKKPLRQPDPPTPRKKPLRRPPPPPPPKAFLIEECPPVGYPMLNPTRPEELREVIPNAVIDPFPHSNHAVDVDLGYLEWHLRREVELGLDLDPPYQRAHVWTEAQRVAFVEYLLRGGKTGVTVVVGHVGDIVMLDPTTCGYQHYSLVDGKQRLDAVRAFLRDDLPVFAHPGRPTGYLASELSRAHTRSFIVRLRFECILFPSYADLLRHYVRLNAGGTPHTAEEIAKVRAMLAEIQGTT